MNITTLEMNQLKPPVKAPERMNRKEFTSQVTKVHVETMEFMRNQGGITAAETAIRFDIQSSAAHCRLKKLVKKGAARVENPTKVIGVSHVYVEV